MRTKRCLLLSTAQSVNVLLWRRAECYDRGTPFQVKICADSSPGAEVHVKTIERRTA